MTIYKVSIETLGLNGNSRAFIYTLGYYKDLTKAKHEAENEIKNNYDKYGSREKPIIDKYGRKEYLITNEASFKEIEVK